MYEDKHPAPGVRRAARVHRPLHTVLLPAMSSTFQTLTLNIVHLVSSRPYLVVIKGYRSLFLTAPTPAILAHPPLDRLDLEVKCDQAKYQRFEVLYKVVENS